MTLKQQAFADYYIELGNATEAARRAGYKCPEASGKENLQKPLILQYIEKRLNAIEEIRVATGDEVMKFFTAVMRGEIQDAFGLDPSLQDRMNAAKELAKRTVDIDAKRDSVDVLENMKTIIDVLQEPRENRNIEDFEGEENE